MSRQRLRPSLVEASTQPCPHCGGTGFIRSTESAALYVLRSIEEEGMRRRSAEVCVYVPTAVALYILNHKRDSLAQLETRYGIRALMARDDALIPPAFRLERLRALEPGEVAAIIPAPLTQAPAIADDEAGEDSDADLIEVEDSEHPAHEGEEERARRRRRRRRRRHEDERGRAPTAPEDAGTEEPAAEQVAAAASAAETDAGEEDEDARLRRRRGRRGGRRRSRRDDGPGPGLEIGHPAAETVEIVASETVAFDAAAFVEDPFEPGEPQPVSADSEMAAPQDSVLGPAMTVTISDIETASLPVFAGDAIPTSDPMTAQTTEAAMPASESRPAAVAAGGESAPPPAPVEFAGANGSLPPFGNRADEPAAEAAAPQREPASESMERVAPPEPQPQPEAPEGQTAPMPDAAFVTEAELVVEAPAPPEPEPAAAANSPAEIVQAVTRKPENPRRGWWQRLIQP
jgi:ribonuclease E